MNLLTIFTLFQSTFSIPLSLNSTFMNKYNQYIQEYNKNFSYDHFQIFKKNLLEINRYKNIITPKNNNILKQL